ncbi:tetratricopeptide repeat protein [Micromonospora sp. NPDC050187]|uniref:fibronectin type III domain-containing protein n=1 Tax=Micromonospora sp. NPDC050187 TaxID=3364277 RepID=UPI003791D4EF
MSSPFGELTGQAHHLVAAGDLSGAQELLADALADADPRPANASPELAEAAGLQARVLVTLGEPHSARGWAAFAYAAMTRLYGTSDQRTVAAAATLAAVLHRVGSYARAARLYQEVIIELTALDGPESLRVLAAHADLATVEYARGECTTARERLQDAWELHREVYGDGHVSGIKMLARLGAMQRDCGHFADAHDNLALARELCRQHLDPDDPLAAQVAGLARAAANPDHACDHVDDAEPPVVPAARTPSADEGDTGGPWPPETADHSDGPGPETWYAGRDRGTDAGYRTGPDHRTDPGHDTAAGHRRDAGHDDTYGTDTGYVTEPAYGPGAGYGTDPGYGAAAGHGPVPRPRVPEEPAGSGPDDAYPAGPDRFRTYPGRHHPGEPAANGGQRHDAGYVDEAGYADEGVGYAGEGVGYAGDSGYTDERTRNGSGGPGSDGGWSTGHRYATDGRSYRHDQRFTSAGRYGDDPDGDDWWPPEGEVDRPDEPTGTRGPTGPALPPSVVGLTGGQHPEESPGVRRVAHLPVRVGSRLPVHVPRPPADPPRRLAPLVVAGVVVVLLGTGAVIAGVARVDEPAGQPQPAPGTGSPPGATPGGTAKPASAAPGAPPGGVTLRDNRDSVTLSWTYPAGAEGPVVVSGGRVGQDARAFQELPAGATNYIVYGLDQGTDYCFTVAVVHSADTVGRAKPVCTKRS